MELIIRADASRAIGTGHVMRCIALGQAWRACGEKVLLMGDCGGESLRQRILSEGFAHVPVDRPHPDPGDLARILEELERASRPWLVLDGYGFDENLQQAIRGSGHRLAVVDDMNHLPAYHADVLLNQNLHAPELSYRYDSDTTRLFGTRYALLRREFLRHRVEEIAAPEKATRVLITLGGADPDNVTGKVLTALAGLVDPQLEARIVVGPANSHSEQLKKAASALPFRTELLTAAGDMSALMQWAHMAVSAAGSTSWELAHAGVPALTVAVFDNQRPLAQKLGEAGAAVDLGWHTALDPSTVRRRFAKLQQDGPRRRHMAQAARALVDGNGAARVAAVLRQSPFYLRRAGINDAALLFRWANAQQVRQSSFSPEAIAWETHLAWFREKLASPESAVFVAVDLTERPVGQIRFDKTDPATAEIDVSVAYEAAGRGYGTALLREGTAAFFADDKEVKTVRGAVKRSNGPSLRIFEKAGFSNAGEESRSGQAAVFFTRSRNGQEGI